jgi:hypothetical protein
MKFKGSIAGVIRRIAGVIQRIAGVIQPGVIQPV